MLKSDADHEVLEEGGALGDAQVGPAREMRRLLEKDGLGPRELAHVDRDALRSSNLKNHQLSSCQGEEGRDARPSEPRRCSS